MEDGREEQAIEFRGEAKGIKPGKTITWFKLVRQDMMLLGFNMRCFELNKKEFKEKLRVAVRRQDEVQRGEAKGGSEERS